MREEIKAKDFIGYEYQEITVKKEKATMYIDCYENFGWAADENSAVFGNTALKGPAQLTLRMKRDRKILNKMELTRLQRQFEACVREVELMEASKTAAAVFWAIAAGILGTVFMAGSVFAVTHEPPVIWLCILLAVPGFAGWISPFFLYRLLVGRQSKKVQPLIEEKQEEIYEVCKKGYALL